MLSLWTVFAVVFFRPALSGNSKELVVSTQHGPVRGTIRRATSSDTPVYSYFGVPYARSPDYSFRFFPPYDPWAWSDTKDATNEKTPFCRQDKERFAKLRKDSWLRFVSDDDHPMSEDCLTVNVFSSVHPRILDSAQKLPVIVWIHGGSFQTSATSNRMWMLPAFENVVLVTVNYRIGVFGFLSLGDQWAPGNTGLYDQVKAFEWVRDNVAHFGGDPDSVTIVGNSAGAFSVSAHTLSPLSKGLFHKVVAMSGAATLPSMWKSDQHSMTNKLAERASCLFHDNSFTATCLRNHLTSSELINVSQSETFLAEVDGKIFPSSPEELISSGSFSKVPMLIGGAAGEFDFTLARKFFPTHSSGKITWEEAKRLIGVNLRKYHSIENDSDLQQSVFDVYLGEANSSKQLMRGVADFYADSWFNWPSDHLASRYKDSQVDVFLYKFASRPSFYNKVKLFPRPFNFNRADHSDGVVFIFGFPFLPGLEEKGLTFTDIEKQLSRKLMKVLANFARTGNPGTDAIKHWPEYPHVVVFNETVSLTQNFLQGDRALWEKIQTYHDKQAVCRSAEQSNACL